MFGKLLGRDDGESEPPLESLLDDRVVQFYGTWCGYCRMIEPDVDRLESRAWTCCTLRCGAIVTTSG
jgi:thiol-disulfide isomerase/thioredoxin